LGQAGAQDEPPGVLRLMLPDDAFDCLATRRAEQGEA
jgi:hypothetical protein